jgi:hypothetical protein
MPRHTPSETEVLSPSCRIPVVEETPYLAVRCVNGHIITLKVLESATKFDETAFPPFDVICSVCKTPQQFGGRQVFLWTGPPPNKDFRNHPAFQ